MNEVLRQPSVVRYRIGDWTVEPLSRRLWKDGQEHTLRPSSMDVLAYLVERPGSPVTHEERLQSIWRGAISSNNAIHKAVAELRQVLANGNPDRDDARYIATIPRRGYRRVAPVERFVVPVTAEHVALRGPHGADAAGLSGQQEREAVPSASPPSSVTSLPAAGQLPTRQVPNRLWLAGAAALAIVLTFALVWAKSWLDASPSNPNQAGVAATTKAEAKVSANTGEEAQGNATPAVRQHTLAVQPLMDTSDSPADVWLVTGLSDELRYRLVNAPQLLVQQADAGDPVEVGRSLQVDDVLHGQLHHRGDQLEVDLSPVETAQGQVAFVLGDVDRGVTWMHQMSEFERGIFINSRWSIEHHFPKEVLEDPRYRDMLELLGMGETFRKTMEAGVRALTPHTGIHLASDAPDKVVLGNGWYGKRARDRQGVEVSRV